MVQGLGVKDRDIGLVLPRVQLMCKRLKTGARS
jgi:hypothetical protein